MKRKGMRKVYDRRKHRDQLEREERSLVERLLSKVRNGGKFRSIKSYRHGTIPNKSGHGRKRFIEREITFNEVFDTVKRGYLVEVHNNTHDDVRCVLRKDYRDKSVSVVISLKRGNVVTAFSDNCHYTLLSNEHLYKWDEDLTKAIPRILKQEVSA